MFNDKLNTSIAEAAKQCMDEAKYEPAAPDPELIAKRKAREAAAAKREEERERKENEFGGGEEKKRPSVQKVAGRAYGGAAQKDDVEESVKSFSGLLESYKEGGIKSLFENLQKEEATEDEFNAELKKAKDKAEGKAPQADVAAAATQGTKDMKEEVEQLDELTGKGQLPSIAAYHKQKGDEVKSSMEKIRSSNYKVPVPKEKSAKIYAKDAQSNYHYNQAKRAKALMAKEEVEQIDESGKDSGQAYLSKAYAAKKGGDKANYHKHMSDYYGHHADRAKGEKNYAGGAGNYIANAQKQKQHAENYRGYKSGEYDLDEETSIDERTLTPGETSEKERIVKGMKKGIEGFKERYGSRAKEVMYATATKQAKKIEEESQAPEGYQHRNGRLIPKIHPKMSAHDHGYDYTHQTIEDAKSKSEINRQHREILKDNPHPTGSKEHKDWESGTHKAKNDVLKNWS